MLRRPRSPIRHGSSTAAVDFSWHHDASKPCEIPLASEAGPRFDTHHLATDKTLRGGFPRCCSAVYDVGMIHDSRAPGVAPPSSLPSLFSPFPPYSPFPRSLVPSFRRPPPLLSIPSLLPSSPPSPRSLPPRLSVLSSPSPCITHSLQDIPPHPS